MKPPSSSILKFRPVVFTLFALGFSGIAEGVTVVYQQGVNPTAGYLSSDTMIRGDGANISLNYGAGAYNIVGKVPASPLRVLYAYTLSDIPAGAIITSVTMTVRGERNDSTSASGAAAFELHQLTGSFDEGTGGLSGAANSGATWNNRANGTTWTTPGGDYSSTVLSSISVDSRAADEVSYTFGSTPELIAAAQNALNGTGTLSMLLKLNDTSEASASRRVFFLYGDDATDATGVTPNSYYRPYLTIEYIPEPSTAILGALAGIGMVVRRKR